MGFWRAEISGLGDICRGPGPTFRDKVGGILYYVIFLEEKLKQVVMSRWKELVRLLIEENM